MDRRRPTGLLTYHIPSGRQLLQRESTHLSLFGLTLEMIQPVCREEIYTQGRRDRGGFANGLEYIV